MSKKFSILFDEDEEILDFYSGNKNVKEETSGSNEAQNTNNKEEKEKKENESSSDEGKGVEVIADKALCTCTNAASPAPVQLKVISQQKVFCNGGSLLTATTMDNTVASLNFGSCKPLQGPCAAMIQWQKPYEDIKVMGALKILTMDSSGMCSTAGGKIEFKTSGQSQVVPPPQSSLEMEVAQACCPLLSTAADSPEVEGSLSEETITTGNIQKALEETVELIEIAAGNGIKKAVSGIEPVTYPVEKNGSMVKQPIRTSCTFKAPGGGTVTWKVRDENMKVLLEESGAAQITVSFPALKRYVIEAYGTSSYVKDETKIGNIEQKPANYKNALIVQGSENEIILKADKERIPVDEWITVTAGKLFKGLAADTGTLNYKIVKAGMEMDASKVTCQSTESGAKIQIKEEGHYTVTAISSKGVRITQTKGIRVENLKVTEVSINKKQEYSTRLGEPFELKAKLNFEGESYQSRIKWKVVENSSNKTLIEDAPKPQASLFDRYGEYTVYAYVNKPTSTVKATLKLLEPLFVSITWKDENGNVIKEIGGREEVHANIRMEAVDGLDIQADLYHSKGQLRSYSYKMKNDTLVISLTTKGLEEGEKLYFKIYGKIGGKLVLLRHQDKTSKEYPIVYTKKEKITSLKFYGDKACKEAISNATYGSTIYARALSRNLSGESLELKIIRKVPEWYKFDKTLHTIESKVDDKGTAIFEIKISNDWQDSGNNIYAAVVTEKGKSAKADNNQSEQQYSIGKDLQFMMFVSETPSMGDGKSPSVVGQTGLTLDKYKKCTKCKEALTLDMLKSITGGIPANFEIRTKDMLPHLNKYMEAFDINKTCWRRAHFLGQMAKECGFWSLFEDLDHTEASLNRIGFPNRKIIIEKGYHKTGSSLSLENQIRIANIGYGTGAKAKSLGNTPVEEKDWADPAKDGYKYRGRGLVQLTGKYNYESFQKWYDRHKAIYNWSNLNFVDDPDLLSTKLAGNKISNPEMMVLSAIYFWDIKGLNALADAGYKGGDVDEISKKVNPGEPEEDRSKRRILFRKALNCIRDRSLCALIPKVSVTKTDIITYHINANGRSIMKQIPSENKYPEKRRYIYYDKAGGKHNIGDFEISYATLRTKYPGGTKIVEKLPAANDKGKIELLYIKDFTGYSSPDQKVRASVGSWESDTYNRYYINPECFAGILGAMLDLNIDFLAFRGSSKSDGSPTPSSTHNNGVATDIAYFNKSKTTTQVLLAEKELDLQLNIDFVDALIDYGYIDVDRFYTAEFIPHGETKERLLTDGMNTCYTPPHNNHLHIGGFDFSTVIIKKT